MEVFNRVNSKNTGSLQTLTSWMLISPQNTSTGNISIQVSEIPVASEQPVHSHSPEQCYYIIKGKGLMIIGRGDQGGYRRRRDLIYPQTGSTGSKTPEPSPWNT